MGSGIIHGRMRAGFNRLVMLVLSILAGLHGYTGNTYAKKREAHLKGKFAQTKHLIQRCTNSVSSVCLRCVQVCAQQLLASVQTSCIVQKWSVCAPAATDDCQYFGKKKNENSEGVAVWTRDPLCVSAAGCGFSFVVQVG